MLHVTKLVAALSAGGVLALSTFAHADQEAGIPAALERLTINGQQLTPGSVRPAPIEGPLYEIRLKNGETFYSDAQGRHMVVGTLYDNAPEGLVNLTEQGERTHRLAQLEQLSRNDLVIFPASGDEQAVITVFTDTTCPYCQMLHQEIGQLNAAGVTVHYVPFPRAGRGSPAAQQLAQVMCSEDPRAAMSAAFEGQTLTETPSEGCLASVDEGYRLGQQFGVQGTPSIVLPSGEMGEGYVPVEQLVQAIGRPSS